jgi:hypothetical protein
MLLPPPFRVTAHALGANIAPCESVTLVAVFAGRRMKAGSIDEYKRLSRDR